MKSKLGLSAVMTFAYLTTACGSTMSAQSGNPFAANVAGSEAVYVNNPTTLNEAAKLASVMVVGRPTGVSNAEKVGQLDAAFTVTEFRVSDVIGGTGLRAGDVIKIRSWSGAAIKGAATDTPVPYLSVDRTFAIFLIPFHFTPNDNIGQWVNPVEPFGMYIRANEGNADSYIAVSSADSKLPSSVSKKELTTVLTNDTFGTGA